MMIKEIWKKEIKSDLYTWKSTLWIFFASLLFSLTSYILLTNKELSLLDQTELLLLLGKIIIGVSLLVVAVDASTTITTEFEKETAESIFLSPITVMQFILGKLLASLTLWGVIFLVAVPYILVASSGTNLALSFLVYTALLGSIIMTGYIVIIFSISLLFRSGKSTLTTSLILVLVFTLAALFSTPLKGSGLIGMISTINPVDNVFSSLDNVLVDYQTSVLQNTKYLVPLIGFLLFGCLLLWIAIRKFKSDGIIKSN